MSPVRRAAGVGCLVLAVLLVPASVAGVWNPWRYVMLRRYLGNPLLDAVVIALFAVLAIWLLAPVRSEAAQHRRVVLRWGAVAAFLGALLCFAGFGSLFDPGQVATVGRFDDLQAVVLTHGGKSEIRAWAGHGLADRGLPPVGQAHRLEVVEAPHGCYLPGIEDAADPGEAEQSAQERRDRTPSQHDAP